MTVDNDAGRPVTLVPPLGFNFEGWPAILIAMGEDTVVLHIEDEDIELAAAKLPGDIRRRVKEQLHGGGGA